MVGVSAFSQVGALGDPGARVVVVGSVAGGALAPAASVVERSVTAITNELTARAGLSHEALTIVLGPATAADLASTVTGAAQAARTLLVVVFVGGAFSGPDGGLYLAATETDPRPGGVGATAVPLAGLLAAVAGVPNRRVAVLVDAFAPDAAASFPAAVPPGLELLVCRSPEQTFSNWRDGASPLAAELVRLLSNGDPAAGSSLALGPVNRRLVELVAMHGLPTAGLVPAPWSAELALAPNPAYTPPLVDQAVPPTQVLPGEPAAPPQPADGPADDPADETQAIVPTPAAAPRPSLVKADTDTGPPAGPPALGPAPAPAPAPANDVDAPPDAGSATVLSPAGPAQPPAGPPGPPVPMSVPGTTVSFLTDPTCPYPGLAPFDEASERWFRGRERARVEVVERLATTLDGSGPLVVVAASGAGKSSLLRAGLLPSLARGAVEGSANWRQVLLTPTERPAVELARRLTDALGVPAAGPAVYDTIVADPYRLPARLAEVTAGPSPVAPPAGRTVVVVDQFEEAFTLAQDARERDGFVRGLCALARGDGFASPPAAVVIAVRADFYAYLAAYPELLGALQGGQVVLGPMTGAEVREAIVEPAREAGKSVEPGLVELMLRDLGVVGGGSGSNGGGGFGAGAPGDGVVADPASLPLLAHALRATWFAREGDTLTVAGYERVGGMSGAIAQTAEQVYAGLDAHQQQLVWPLLMRMIRIGDGGDDDTRRRVRREELLGEVADPQAAVVLGALVARRLVVVDADTVQISHEALLRSWPRLREWIDLDRSGAVAWQQLAEASLTWDRGGQDPSFLIRGVRLAAARTWVEAGGRLAGLSPTVRSFLEASIAREKAEAQAAQRRTRRLKALVAVMTVLALLASAATGFAFVQRSEVAEQRDEAQSQAIAERSRDLGFLDTSLASQLSLVAFGIADTYEARTALLEATTATRHLGGHTLPIGAVAYSPDGRLIATASDDHSVALWDGVEYQRPNPLGRIPDFADGGHEFAVKSVAFNRESTVMATGGADGTTMLWDVRDAAAPVELATLPEAADDVSALAFSPAEDLLAVGGYDTDGDFGDVALFDVTDPADPDRVGTLYGHTGEVRAIGFSPDGDYVVTGSRDGTAKLWSVANPAAAYETASLEDESGEFYWVDAVAFALDGDSVLTGDADGVVNSFDVSNPFAPTPVQRVLVGSSVTDLDYLADGAVGVTTEGTFAYVIAPGESSERLAELRHGWVTWSGAASPDGRTFVTGAEDGVLRRWQYDGLVYGSGVSLTSSAMWSDEAVYATGDDQGEVALWRLADDGRVERLSSVKAHDDRVFATEVDGAGELLATSSFGEVALWDVAEPAQRPELLATVPVEAEGSAYSVSLSPDGARLATGGPNGDVTLWDVSDPSDPVPLATGTDGHRANSFVRAVRFSPDGSTLTSVAEDRNVINWEVSGDGLDEISRLPTTVGKFNALAYSPDGSTMAAGGDGRVVYLYDVTDPAAPREITRIAPHDGAIWALDFSPDGRTLAAGGSDVRLWDVSHTAAPEPAGDFTFLPATRVHFTPDGRYLLPLTGTAAVLPYDLDVNAISNKICDLVGAPITEEEWSQYLPDLAYDPPCD